MPRAGSWGVLPVAPEADAMTAAAATDAAGLAWRLPPRWWRWPLYVVAPALLIGGMTAWQQGLLWPDAERDLPALFPTPYASWDEHVAAIDLAMETHRMRAAQEPTDWLSPSAEAGAWLDRAQFTGRWQDIAEAERSLALAMQRAEPATRPWLLAARLALTLHRQRDIEPLLASARADRQFALAPAQAEARMLRGDIALYSGDWRQADRLYAEAQALGNDPSLGLRRALIVERTGDADAAIAAIIAATHATDQPTRPLLALAAARIGNVELARGHWDDAARWYARADRALPGDWRIVSLQLQMQALRGDLSGAIAGMRRLAERHDLPQLWDALAAWQRAAGESAAAAQSTERAAAGWQAWLARYPEAAYAHAAEHALQAGDSATALRHARANFANRPYGDAALLLATAQSANGDVAGARRTLARSTASGWRTVESDRLAFELAALDGDTDAAEAARAAALARNPRAFDPAMALIRFGLH